MKTVIQQYQAFFLILLMLGLQACGSANPLARAETVEQKAYATYGTFVVIEEQAAKLVSSGEISSQAVRAIASADARVKPVADSLLEAVLEFEEIRAEYEAGGTGEALYLAAISNLSNWIERAQPLITNLIVTVKGAK